MAQFAVQLTHADPFQYFVLSVSHCFWLHTLMVPPVIVWLSRAYPSSVKHTDHWIIELPPTVAVAQVLHPLPVLEHLMHVFPLVR